MCTGGDPGGGSSGGGSSAPKPKPKAKPKAAPNFGALKSSQRPMPQPKATPIPKTRVKSAPSSGSGGSENQASASAPPPESSAARAARLQRERAKASEIRRKAAAKSVAGKTEAQIRRDTSPAPSLTRGQSAASARATGMAKNRAAISELRGRMDEQPPGTLGAIGRASLERQVKALGQGAIPVQIKSDSGIPITVGTIGTTSKQYTGRSEYRDIAMEAVKKGGTLTSIDTSLKAATARQQSQQERDEPRREPVVEEPVSMTPVGTSSGRTTKTRRGGGRRTAFGTRQSLVNLRNV